MSTERMVLPAGISRRLYRAGAQDEHDHFPQVDWVAVLAPVQSGRDWIFIRYHLLTRDWFSLSVFPRRFVPAMAQLEMTIGQLPRVYIRSLGTPDEPTELPQSYDPGLELSWAPALCTSLARLHQPDTCRLTPPRLWVTFQGDMIHTHYEGMNQASARRLAEHTTHLLTEKPPNLIIFPVAPRPETFHYHHP